MSLPLQVAFLKLVQARIPKHINSVDALSELLGVGVDSVYRRLRGETALTFEEALLVSQTYGVTLDQSQLDSTARVDFDAGPPIRSAADYALYSQRVVSRMLQLESNLDSQHMYYMAQDFPLFYIYLFPRMMRLKSYYWGRSILGLPEFQNLPYEAFHLPEDRQKLGDQVFRAYAHIPSTEVWTQSCYIATLKQLQYCCDTGIIQDMQEVQAILDELLSLLELMRKQSDSGRKFNPVSGEYTGAAFTWYVTELSVGNNSVFVERPGAKHSFLSYNTFNFIETTHEAFNSQTQAWLKELLKKSTLVTSASQAIRDAYLHKLARQTESIRRAIMEREDSLL